MSGANGFCPCCGESLVGDGFRVVLHCPSGPEGFIAESEPDASPIYCGNTGREFIISTSGTGELPARTR